MKDNSKQPHRGAIAICSNGSVGLITSNTKVPVPFPEQPDYEAWTGIQISPSPSAEQRRGRVVGDTWCSGEPTVIFTTEELRSLGNTAYLFRNLHRKLNGKTKKVRKERSKTSTSTRAVSRGKSYISGPQ